MIVKRKIYCFVLMALIMAGLLLFYNDKMLNYYNLILRGRTLISLIPNVYDGGEVTLHAFRLERYPFIIRNAHLKTELVQSIRRCDFLDTAFLQQTRYLYYPGQDENECIIGMNGKYFFYRSGRYTNPELLDFINRLLDVTTLKFSVTNFDDNNRRRTFLIERDAENVDLTSIGADETIVKGFLEKYFIISEIPNGNSGGDPGEIRGHITEGDPGTHY